MTEKKKRGRPRKNPISDSDLESVKKGIEQAQKGKFTKDPPDLKTVNAPKRIKLCPCGEEVGRKVRTCKKCGNKFTFKKGRYEEIKKWRELKDGHTFVLKNGSLGPYFNGEKGRILMGYRGHFTVKRIYEDGILAYSAVDGMAFLYMGPTKFIEDTSIYRRKYRLYKKI